MSDKRTVTVFVFITAVYTVFLTWLLLMDPVDVGSRIPLIIRRFLPPAAHLVTYAILAALLRETFRRAGLKPGMLSLTALSVALAHGLLTETLQAFHPLRDASAADFFLNLAGAFLGVCVLDLAGRMKQG